MLREGLREKINRNRQEIKRSKKRLKDRTNKNLAMNLSRMASEAEERERDDYKRQKHKKITEKTKNSKKLKIKRNHPLK